MSRGRGEVVKVAKVYNPSEDGAQTGGLNSGKSKRAPSVVKVHGAPGEHTRPRTEIMVWVRSGTKKESRRVMGCPPKTTEIAPKPVALKREAESTPATGVSTGVTGPWNSDQSPVRLKVDPLAKKVKEEPTAEKVHNREPCTE
jgi:hypothetical protein